MRVHRTKQPKKLWRKVNTTTWGVRQNNPGGEYRWERHKMQSTGENQPHRQTMNAYPRGRDYTPLYLFLISKVGQKWDDVFSEAVSRLDSPAPVFHLVRLHRSEWQSYVSCGESSYYSGLCVDDDGFIQKINPEFSAEDIPVRHLDYTYTFNGKRVPVTEKNWMKPFEAEIW